MLSPRNATIVRSARSATARRSAASTGSPRRIGSPASPVMKRVVWISSGAAATPGGGSGRGTAHAASAIAAIIAGNFTAEDAKELQRRRLFTTALAVGRPLRPLRLKIPALQSLTSIAVG